jgi:histone H3/H4
MENLFALLPFEKIAKKSGISRISKSALLEIRENIEEMATETGEKIVKLAQHAERRTIIERDVKFFKGELYGKDKDK